MKAPDVERLLVSCLIYTFPEQGPGDPHPQVASYAVTPDGRVEEWLRHGPGCRRKATRTISRDEAGAVWELQFHDEAGDLFERAVMKTDPCGRALEAVRLNPAGEVLQRTSLLPGSTGAIGFYKEEASGGQLCGWGVRTWDGSARLIGRHSFSADGSPLNWVRHSYDREGRLERTVHHEAGRTLLIWDYFWDMAHRKVARLLRDQNGALLETAVRRFDADGLPVEEHLYTGTGRPKARSEFLNTSRLRGEMFPALTYARQAGVWEGWLEPTPDF